MALKTEGRMKNNSKEPVEIECEIVRSTEKAILIKSGKTEAWIPKSQIINQVFTKEKQTGIEIPEWLAYDKELI